MENKSLLFLELALPWRTACLTPQVLKLRKNAEFASIALSFCFGARGTLPPATLVAGRWTGAWICHRAPQHNLHKPGNQSGELSWTNFSRPSQSSSSLKQQDIKQRSKRMCEPKIKSSPDGLDAEKRYTELDERESLGNIYMRAATLGIW